MSQFDRPFQPYGKKYFYCFADMRYAGDRIVYHSDKPINEISLRMFQSAASTYGMKHGVRIRTGRIDSNTIEAAHAGERRIESAEDRKARLDAKRAKYPNWGLK